MSLWETIGIPSKFSRLFYEKLACQDDASKARLQEARKELSSVGEELAPLRARYQQAPWTDPPKGRKAVVTGI